MKLGRITVRLEYEFPDSMSDEDIAEKLENIELPEQYVEDSYEYNGVLDIPTKSGRTSNDI